MNQTAESLWFVFYKDELLLEKEGNGTFAIPCGEIPPILIKDKTTVHNITTLEGRNCKAYSVSQPIEETDLVAGFLETGETLEECVAREVKEETGLDVKNITYFGNQPWPYPSGLMVGFIADYAGGEIKLQEEELSSGDFYTRDNLPELPRKLSLARKMIDWWLECSHK